MKVIEYSKKLEDLIKESNLEDIANAYKEEYSILSSLNLEKIINEVKESGRLLKIGIIGSVNAGKSSLINALLFDGKDILPKAATPMTAALTKIEYSEDIKAKVEFYTVDDIEELKKEYELYNSRYDNLKKDELNKLQKRSQEPINQSELVTKAENIVNRIMKSDKLFASYDQYSRIKTSIEKPYSDSNYKEIEASNIDDLNDKLYDYVGAEGKYMAFTKSVTLGLNIENLKDIEVIDTPGINDPITSREARTKEMLKSCDVVFIISPAGQFLNSNDLELLDRISTRESVQEIYIIASKVDSQLYGSVKDRSKGNFIQSLEDIRKDLKKHLDNSLKAQIKNFPEQEKILQNIMKNDLIISSGMAYSLLVNYDKKDLWNEYLKHTWDSLMSSYKDYFNEDKIAKSNLKNLSEIDKIQILLKQIKDRKNEIIESKQKSIEKDNFDNLQKFKDVLEKEVEANIKRIKSSDLNEIAKQKEALEKTQKKSEIEVSDAYTSLVENLEFDIKEPLNKSVERFFKETQKGIKDSETTETESWTTGMWWWKENHTRDFPVVKAGVIRDIIEDLTFKLEDEITDKSKIEIRNWRKKLYSNILPILENNIGSENIDLNLIVQIVRGVLGRIDYPEIEYSGSLPQELMRSGTLKDYEADEFINASQNYMRNLKTRVIKDIRSYLQSLTSMLSNIKIEQDIFKDYAKKIADLEHDILNKEISIERNNNILLKLKALS